MSNVLFSLPEWFIALFASVVISKANYFSFRFTPHDRKLLCTLIVVLESEKGELKKKVSKFMMVSVAYFSNMVSA